MFDSPELNITPPIPSPTLEREGDLLSIIFFSHSLSGLSQRPVLGFVACNMLILF